MSASLSSENPLKKKRDGETMDLEGYTARLLRNGEDGAQLKLKEQLQERKNISPSEAAKLSAAILEETKAALSMTDDVFVFDKSGVSMGEFGVGSRGSGDFYVHGKIGQVIGKTSAVLDALNADDSGVVALKDKSDYLIVTVDGMHSRLSAFPFLAGFHAAKAALRDIYVMGAQPLAMLSDIHVADDGDVAMIFDHLAGIGTVAELSGIPLVTGSTLRIGGDMVTGERMTGGVGAVGAAAEGELTARRTAEPGDLILMTEGTGGGTVTTAAVYSGYEKAEEVVDKTLNIDFLKAAQALLNSKDALPTQIHAMTDVTNGGIRGDVFEISQEAQVRLVLEDAALRQCVHPCVLEMTEKLGIDFRGVSIDSLLVICPPGVAEAVIREVEKAGVRIFVVGRIEEREEKKYNTALIVDGVEKEFQPLFRESAYTPLKKAIGEKTPPNFEEMKKGIDAAADAAVEKKKRMVQKIRSRK